MRTPEERRTEQRRFEADVLYDAWRAGGNPDAISPDRLSDRWWNDESAEQAARAELRLQRKSHDEPGASDE